MKYGISRSALTCLLAASLFSACGKKKAEQNAVAEPAAESKASVDEKPKAAAAGENGVISGEPGLRTPPTPSADPSGQSEPAPAPAAPLGAGSTAADLAASDAVYDAWFKKYGLDLNDPRMLDDDTDGDGFTNREEFMADTNPLDKNSRPGVHDKMRVKEFSEVKLPFVLRSVEGDSAKIEMTDEGEGKVEMVKAGQTLRGSQMRVERVEVRRGKDKDGHPVDASRVTLENPSTKQRTELVKDMPARSASTYAVLVSGAGDTTLTVHQGDTFSWPSDPSVAYRVVDLRAEQVILEQLDNKKMWTVPRQ